MGDVDVLVTALMQIPTQSSLGAFYESQTNSFQEREHFFLIALGLVSGY